MKNRPSATTSTLVKTPTENFISTVTNFQSYYGVGQQHHERRKSLRSYPTPSYSDPSGATGNTADVPLVNFLLVYYDFAYFLLVCPFRIVTDKDTGKFFIKKNRLQMILCAATHVLCFFRLVTEVRASIDKEYSCINASKNPVQYFNIIMDVSSLVYKTIIIKRFWFNQVDYLVVLIYIQTKDTFRKKPTEFKFFETVFFLRCCFCLVTAHAFSSLLVGKNFVPQSYSWSTSLWSNQLVKLARFTFCFEKNFNIQDVTPITNLSNVDTFLAVVMSICLIGRFIIGIFCDLFLLCHTVTLWLAAKSFSNRIEDNLEALLCYEREQWSGGELCPINSDHQITKTVDYQPNHVSGKFAQSLHWEEIYRHFRTVQKLSMLINLGLGSLVTWYMAEAIMYYSVRLNKFLTSMDIFVRLDLAVFYSTTFGILFISADVCSQMESIKVWISFGDNRKTVPTDEFSIVLHEMIVKDIGIRGSNVFTITYSLLAVFFSTIVTYFIICVQQGDSVSGFNIPTSGNITNETSHC